MPILNERLQNKMIISTAFQNVTFYNNFNSYYKNSWRRILKPEINTPHLHYFMTILINIDSN